MHKCLICGREFKNDAGLTGHVRMIHPSAVPVDGKVLKARLEAVEESVLSLRRIVQEIMPALQSMTATIHGIVKAQSENQTITLASNLLHAERSHGVAVDIDELPEPVRLVFKQMRKASTLRN